MNQPYGQRLLIHLIDERAAALHERPYASIPRSREVSDGFLDISYRVLANAVNRAAIWLREQFGSSEDLAAIVYLGPADLRYQILSLAAVKSGHVMFFPSPRNTADAFDALLDQANTASIITDQHPARTILDVIAKRSMTHVVVPSLDVLLHEQPVEHIAVNATFDQWRFRPWILLHTSGSTGTPKIVPIKHGMISGIDAWHLAPQSDVTSRYGKMRVFVPFPPFHIAGITFSLTQMCWYDSTAVFPPAGRPLTADLVHQVHMHANISHSILAPSLIVDLAKNPDYLEALARLSGMTFSGGPLPADTAEKVAPKVKLASSMGATEFGGIPMLSDKAPEDYNYFKFNEALAGVEFRESEQPGLYELVFVRKPDYPSHLVQAIFVTFPELDEYHTRDVFSKHPSKPGLWKYEARLDDVIVLNNGEKFNPLPMEGTIASCPAVKSCLVVGQGRFQAALLVEPNDETCSREHFLVEVKSYIDAANKLCPSHGRIAHELVFVMQGEKKLARAPKGTVQRARSNALFKEEISQLYTDVQTTSSRQSRSEVKINISSYEHTEASLQRWLQQDLDVAGLEPTHDLFEQGMDSLRVINLVRAVNTSLPPDRSKIDPTIVYENPTIAKLALTLQCNQSYTDTSLHSLDAEEEADKADWTAMEKLYLELRGPVAQSRTALLGFDHKLRSSRPPPIFPPDGGVVAWSQVLASFLINMNNWGLVNSFGVFQAYYASALPDSSATSISWIGTSQAALLLIVGVVSGPLFDKGYFGFIFVLASLGVVFGMMMLSLATEYYQILLAQGIFLGLCLGLLYIPSIALISLYFKEWRGTALGLATAGGSAGGIIYPIVFARILDQVGFPWACRVIGFVSLVISLSAACLIRPVGAHSTGIRQLFDPQAFTDLPFVTFLIAGFLVFSGVLVPFFLVTEYARTLNMDTNVTFYCATILNAAQLAGRVLPAALSDWSERRRVPGPELILISAQVIAGVLAFCWIAIKDFGGFVVWLIIYGFFSGMNVTLAAVVLPYVCPSLAVMGSRLGMLYGFAGLGVLMSTPVALAANRSSGGYLGSQAWTGACCLAGACFNIVTVREARRRRRLYETRKPRNLLLE